jgi:hypothetical protein
MRVLGRDREHQLVAGVGADRLAQLPGELAQVLVGQAQRQPVLARLRQRLIEADRQVQKIVRLVRVCAGVAAGGLPHPGAVGRRLPHLRQHEAAEQPAGLLPQQPLGHTSQQHPALVEQPVQVEAGGAAGDHAVDERAQEERAELVEHRADRLRASPAVELLVPVPEALQPRVGRDGGDIGTAKLRVTQQPRHVRKGHLTKRLAQQGQAAGTQDVVGAGSPVGAGDAAEDPHHVVHGQVGVWPVEHIEDRRCLVLGRVQQHQPLADLLGQPLQQVVHQVTAGVDHHHTAGLRDVVENHVDDQGRLAGAGGADDVQVMTGVGRGDRDRTWRASVGVAEHLADAAQPRDRRDRPGGGADQPGHGRVGRQVGEGGQLRDRQQITAA